MFPLLEQGTVSMEFSILKNGSIEGLRYAAGSGHVAMDRAAYGAITSSLPFAPLPPGFKGESLRLRFTFAYNPREGASGNNNERVRLSEILLSTKSVSPGEEQGISALHKRADNLLAQIRAGADFSDLAKSNSDDPSAVLGGDLGVFRRGVLAKSIEDVVFNLKLGDITDVIRTKQGFIILKVTAHLGTATSAAVPAAAKP